MSYRAHEFAQLAGVTVRTLHHYDRIGLLKARRSPSGYRIYTDADLPRLEQIVALKFLGIALADIRPLLDRSPHDFAQALAVQRQVLEQKKRLLDRAIQAIGEAEKVLARGEQPGAPALKQIIEVMEMQDSSDWAMRYYSESAQEKIKERLPAWTPELQAKAEADWLALYKEAESLFEEDPAGPRAQALGDRWMKMVEGFTQGDPELTSGVKALYADKQNWPPDFQERMKPFRNPSVWEYMQRVLAIRKTRAS